MTFHSRASVQRRLDRSSEGELKLTSLSTSITLAFCKAVFGLEGAAGFRVVADSVGFGLFDEWSSSSSAASR